MANSRTCTSRAALSTRSASATSRRRTRLARQAAYGRAATAMWPVVCTREWPAPRATTRSRSRSAGHPPNHIPRAAHNAPVAPAVPRRNAASRPANHLVSRMPRAAQKRVANNAMTSHCESGRRPAPKAPNGRLASTSATYVALV